VPAPDGLGTDVIAVPPASPIELELLLESVQEGVLVTGTAAGVARGACVRCLDGMELEFEVPVRELFVYPEREQAARESGLDSQEEPVLCGETADLEPAVRDAIVLALPFQPVCRETCPGLCPRCGARLEDQPEHRHDDVDPRWSALQGLSTRGEES
jgi:uncharacterized protein